jgi:hypothetical protein
MFLDRTPLFHFEDGGFRDPMMSLRWSLVWAWLFWHEQKDFQPIRDALTQVVQRGIHLDESLQDTRHREYHDSFLLQCAVLSGDLDLMRAAAAVAVAASSEGPGYQYLHAWNGILKFRIRGEADRELEQWQVFVGQRRARYYEWPAEKLVRAFVVRDHKEFARAYKQAGEKHWGMAEKEGALLRRGEAGATLDLEKKHEHFLWPWAAATFGKLACQEGWTPTYDSIWLPLDLVRTMH